MYCHNSDKTCTNMNTTTDNSMCIPVCGFNPVENISQIHPSNVLLAPRMRKSPYFESTLIDGVLEFMVYNHMLLPSKFNNNPDIEYEYLINDVVAWDVGAQRQVEIEGPDAPKLVQFLTPRYIGNMKPGQCKYIVVCNQEGCVLNDPVLLKLEENKFWLSLADSDLLLWIQGLALGLGFNVKVIEPDVSPLAIQGPKSLELISKLLGKWVKKLSFFECCECKMDNIPIVLARSGWSPELGYEIYLRDSSFGSELWEKVLEAGAKPAGPNQARRIEGGLLSYGGDFDSTFSALELGFPEFMFSAMNKDEINFIGKEALLRQRKEGTAQRRIVGILINGVWNEKLKLKVVKPWNIFSDFGNKNKQVGKITAVAWSPRLRNNIAIGNVISPSLAIPGTYLIVELPDGRRVGAQVSKLPFTGTVSHKQREKFST